MGAAELDDGERPNERGAVVSHALLETALHLIHRLPDVRLAWMDVALGRVHVGVAGKDVERERVHVLGPAGDAGVPEGVEDERC